MLDAARELFFRNGYQGTSTKGSSYHYAIAVHDGLVTVPEPVSMLLFVVGGALLGFRQWRSVK